MLNDKLDMPPAGKASVRVINAALSVPLADVGPVDGRIWAQDVEFGTETSYVDCPLGNWDLKVSSDQTSVFFRLDELRPGDAVEVTRSDGQVITYRVVTVESHPKSAFPTARVYGPTPGAELRLITCGGDFDRNSRPYLDNVVVTAVPGS